MAFPIAGECTMNLRNLLAALSYLLTPRGIGMDGGIKSGLGSGEVCVSRAKGFWVLTWLKAGV